MLTPASGEQRAVIRGLSKVAVAATLLVVATMAPGSPDNRATDRRILEKGESEWGASFVNGDVATADRLLEADFLATSSEGERYDKQKLLGWLREGPNVTSNTTTVTNIRFFGDVAVVQGHDAVVDAAPGLEHYELVWTDVWVLHDATWKIVSAHDTKIKSKP